MADPHVHYKGNASVRSFVEEDFTRHGITDQGDVEFNHGNRWTAQVSPEAAGFLVGTTEFEKVAAPVDESVVEKKPLETSKKEAWEKYVKRLGGDPTGLSKDDLIDEAARLEGEIVEEPEQQVPQPGEAVPGENAPVETPVEPS